MLSRNSLTDTAAQLAEETNEGFWLLETLDILEAAEERQHDDAKMITRKRRTKDKPEPPEEQHHMLDYERFIAGRHLRSDHHGLWASSEGNSCDGGSSSSCSVERPYCRSRLARSSLRCTKLSKA